MKFEKKEETKEEYNISPDLALIRESLEYYDKHYELYKKKFIDVTYLKIIKSDNDHVHDEIHFFDNDKKLLFKSRFEFIGIHESQLNIWSWAWSIPYLNKKRTNIIKKILNYGIELETSLHYLKSELITSRFKINHSIQLDIHYAIASYLAKKPVIYKYKLFEFAKYDENNLINIKDHGIEQGNDKSSHTNFLLYLLDYEQFFKD